MAHPRKKEQSVILVTRSGEKQSFGIKHAERLLDMGPEVNGGWEIDPDSNYYYDEENGIRVKTDTGNSAKA
jgi:hypothetical protein